MAVTTKTREERVVIEIAAGTRERLHKRKGVGISYDDVITDLLDDADEARAEDTKA